MSFFSKPQAEGASPFSNANPFQASASQNNNSPFSNLNTSTGASQQPASSSLFGSTAQQQQGVSNPFGGSTQQQPANSNTASLFGRSTLPGSNNQQNNTSSSDPFGGSSNLLGGSTNLLGGSTQNTQQQPANETTSNLFGNLGSNNKQQNSNTSNLFGGSQSQQGTKNWWRGNANFTESTAANLFGGSIQTGQQQQHGQASTMLESRLLKQPDALTRMSELEPNPILVSTC